MNKLTWGLLFLITLLGGFLRLYNLSNSPPSLNWDEAALGYNAYSVWQTGRDEYKVAYPIFTRSFDEYKSMIPAYLMIPSIKIFGLNEFGVRFPSALAGTLSIILIFFLAKYFFRDNKVALFSSLFFAVEPWTILFSRTYHEANWSLFFVLLGILLLLHSLKKPTLLALSIIPLGVSMYSYNASKILVPLIIALFIYKRMDFLKKVSGKLKFISLFLLLVFTTPFIYLALAGQVFARLGPTNILVLWPKEGPIYYRAFLFVWDIIGRYFAYFSPANLFLREPTEPGTIVSGNSVFFAFEFLPIFVGLIFILKEAKRYKELLVLILLAPIPAVVTWNWFQPGRVMVLLSMFSILAGFGVFKIIDFTTNAFKKSIKPHLSKAILISAMVFYVSLSAFYVFDSTQVLVPIRDNGSWQPGFRETVPAVIAVFDRYQKVVVDTPHTQPHIFYLFYGKYSPARYHQELDLEKIGTPRKSYDFGKFEFRKIDWQKDGNLANTLFVGSDDNLPEAEIKTSDKVNFIQEVWDWRELKVAKLVGTK